MELAEAVPIVMIPVHMTYDLNGIHGTVLISPWSVSDNNYLQNVTM